MPVPARVMVGTSPDGTNVITMGLSAAPSCPAAGAAGAFAILVQFGGGGVAVGAAVAAVVAAVVVALVGAVVGCAAETCVGAVVAGAALGEAAGAHAPSATTRHSKIRIETERFSMTLSSFRCRSMVEYVYRDNAQCRAHHLLSLPKSYLKT